MTIRMVFFLKRQQTHRTISHKSETPCERRITHDQRIPPTTLLNSLCRYLHLNRRRGGSPFNDEAYSRIAGFTSHA